MVTFEQIFLPIMWALIEKIYEKLIDDKYKSIIK